MKQIKQIITSRTVITILIAFLTAGFQGTSNYFSPEVFTLIQGILAIFAMYFKINPSQKYGK